MEQGSEPLEGEGHEAFAAHFAVHGNASQAWLLATGGMPHHANANGSKWAKKGSIAARVAWIKNAADELLRQKADKKNRAIVLTVARKREILCDIAEDGEKDSDRINAIKEDNDMAGEGATAGALISLAEQLSNIRTKKGA